MILKQGSQGPDVEQLQLKLKAAGYDPGDVDGDYGKRTADAVLAFQADRPDLEDDGVAGPHTLAALDAAVAKKAPDKPVPPAHPIVPCEAATWTAFQRLVASIVGHPVRYGPGRGLWSGGKLIVTCGPGSLGLKSWPNMLGKPYASFHCTSWANFFLGWLLRRNQDYTHAGNIPSVFDLCEKDASLHKIDGGGVYRGYGDSCSRILPDGSGIARSKFPRDPKIVDARELLARRASLPTFIVCGQSTRRSDGSWNLWHHVVVFVVDHSDNHRLYRIAADGFKDKVRGYSGAPMHWVEITDGNVGNYDAAVYRPYGVNTADGTYGDQKRPIADVDFEIP